MEGTDGRVENPILAGTFIPGVIPPTDIWNALYEYLSSLRDKPFTDSRSDVQKLESAGFDKKTSFRNMNAAMLTKRISIAAYLNR